MSLWKFGNFEAEVDFADADFLDKLDDAKKTLDKMLQRVPKTGKAGDIIRAQCACFYAFFDTLFWDGAGDAIFEGKNSMTLCVEASDSLAKFQEKQMSGYKQVEEKYMVKNHGNRQQRRAYDKNSKNKRYPREYQ